MRISDWSSDVCSSDLPAARGDHAVLRIDRDDDAAGVVARRLADQLGILEGRGADHDTVNAKRKPAIDRRAVADSAAKLHLAFERLQYAFDGLGVDGATGTGPVQIERSAEHTSELQPLIRIPYSVFCLKKKKTEQKRRK